MKQRPSFYVSVLLAPLLLAFVNPNHNEESCINYVDQIQQEPLVASTLNSIGGLDKLLGMWKLSGFEGSLVSVKVTIFTENHQFFVQVNKDERKEVWICSSPAQPNILLIRIQKPARPENALFKIQPEMKANAISVAAPGSNWKYKTFKKITPEI